MATATLNLRLEPRRMLSGREAAAYCGHPPKRFLAECPVAPLRFPSGIEAFDIQDLDQWLDSIKAGQSAASIDGLIERLK